MSKKNEIIKNRISDSLQYIIYLAEKLSSDKKEDAAIKSEIRLHASLSKSLLKHL